MMRLPIFTLPLLDHLLYMVVTDHHMPRFLWTAYTLATVLCASVIRYPMLYSPYATAVDFQMTNLTQRMLEVMCAGSVGLCTLSSRPSTHLNHYVSSVVVVVYICNVYYMSA